MPERLNREADTYELRTGCTSSDRHTGRQKGQKATFAP